MENLQHQAIKELQALVAEHYGKDDLQAELKAMRAADFARETMRAADLCTRS